MFLTILLLLPSGSSSRSIQILLDSLAMAAAMAVCLLLPVWSNVLISLELLSVRFRSLICCATINLLLAAIGFLNMAMQKAVPSTFAFSMLTRRYIISRLAWLIQQH